MRSAASKDFHTKRARTILVRALLTNRHGQYRAWYWPYSYYAGMVMPS